MEPGYDIEQNDFFKFITSRKDQVYRMIIDSIPAREPAGHYELIADYPRRQGKYIRPGLLLLVSDILGGDVDKAMGAAAAMQMSEDWILIHDDIEDGGLTRRGRPTLHTLEGSSLELAVNAGDALHMLQWKVLMETRNGLGPDTAFRLFDEMNEFMLVTAEGQYMEMRWTMDNTFVTTEEYYRMVDRKTGSYTIGGPMRLGAICAGAGDKVLEDLRELSVPLGRAFQIHDDWLDIYSKKLDKDRCGDLVEGKRTLLIVHAYEQAEPAERKMMEEYFNRNREDRMADDSLEPNMLSLFEKYGCREYVRGLAESNAEMSRKLINGFAWLDEKGRRRMNDVVDLIILREV